MSGALILTAALILAAAFLLVRARFWPYGACWACRGRRGRGLGSTGGAYNRCHFCGGKGEQIRLLARIYPQWRDEARRRKEARK